MSRVIYWVSLIFGTVFLVAPLISIWPLSVNTSSFLTYPLEGFTTRWFADVMSGPQWIEPFKNSLKVALGVVVVASVIGGLAAMGVMMMGKGAQIVLSALFISPIIVPSIVIAVAFAYSFGRVGIGGGYLSLVVSHSILATPLVFLSVFTSLRGLDLNLDLAGSSLGASRLYRFRTITLPLAAPGFAAGAVFAFIASFDEVVVALFLADPSATTLPIAIFSGLRDRLEPSIVVVAVLLSALSLVLMWMMSHIQKRVSSLRP